jgi:hypothetical protein
MFACNGGHMDIASFLVSKGAEASMKEDVS